MTMLPGNIGILENTRFHLGEEANDPAWRRGWRRLATFTSTTLSPPLTAPMLRPRESRFLLPSFAGRAMEAELRRCERALGDPERPVAAVVGGAKVSSKLAVLGHLVARSIT